MTYKCIKVDCALESIHSSRGLWLNGINQLFVVCLLVVLICSTIVIDNYIIQFSLYKHAVHITRMTYKANYIIQLSLYKHAVHITRIYIYNSVLTCRQHIINPSASAPPNATKIAVKKVSDVDVCMFGPELYFSMCKCCFLACFCARERARWLRAELT